MKFNKKIILSLAVLFPLLSGCDGQENNTLSNALEYARNHTFEIYGDVYTVQEAGGETSEVLLYKISNVFDTKILDNKITYIYNYGAESYEQLEQNVVFAKDDGFAYYRTINLQNEVVDLAITDNDKNVEFDGNYTAPFGDLNYSDLMAIDRGDFTQYIVKPQISTNFCKKILMQDIKCKRAYFTFENGKFDYLEVTTQSGSSIVAGITNYYRYELRFKWDAHTTMPEIKPYEHYASHDVLKSALFNINRSISNQNFTATTKLSNGSASTEFHYYATENNVYSDYAGSSNVTIGARKDGQYWYQYTVKDAGKETQTITIYDESPFNGDLVFPQYTKPAVELFKPDSTGKVFTAYPEFAQTITYYLAPFTESSSYASNIESISIKLNDSNAFDSLIISFSDYSTSYVATVTYSEFGTTEVPVM